MKANRIVLFLGISALATTAGCETGKPKVDNAQYWQRSAASETVYINGPKAQQLLNRDISRCVTELRELERLGQIKDAIPTNHRGRILNPDEMELNRVDTPERDGYLFAEHKNYQDFESCMRHAGWERTRTITYAATERAESNFFANHVRFKDGMPDLTERGEKSTIDNKEYND